MSNPLKDYKDAYRANLPAGVTFNTTIVRYFFGSKRFITIKSVGFYRAYIAKFSRGFPDWFLNTGSWNEAGVWNDTVPWTTE